jgi:hypothetical protein
LLYFVKSNFFKDFIFFMNLEKNVSLLFLKFRENQKYKSEIKIDHFLFQYISFDVKKLISKMMCY